MSRQFIQVTPVRTDVYGDMMLIPVESITLVHVDTSALQSNRAVIWVDSRSMDGWNCYLVTESIEDVEGLIEAAS